MSTQPLTPGPLAPPPAGAQEPLSPRAQFPRARWASLLFVAIWVPAYASVYGWGNFLHLCDVTVVLTAAGLWWGSPLLLSSQATLAMVVNLVWAVDVGARLLFGRHLLGGTEYMWNPQYPLFVRLLSLFHIALPPLLILAVRRTGYDRRGLALAAGIVTALFAASRLLTPEAGNLNFVFRDPLFRRSFGPGIVHVGLTIAVFVGVVLLPTHWLLARRFARPRSPRSVVAD